MGDGHGKTGAQNANCDQLENRQMVLTLEALFGTKRLRQDLKEWASTLSGKRSQRPETLQLATRGWFGSSSSVRGASPVQCANSSQLGAANSASCKCVQELIALTLGASCRASAALTMTSATSGWCSCTILRCQPSWPNGRHDAASKHSSTPDLLLREANSWML